MIRSFALFLVATVALADDPATVEIAPCKAFSLKEAKVELLWNGKPSEKGLVTIADFTKPAALPYEGPYDLRFTPKGGLSVTAKSDWNSKAGANTIQLADFLGTVTVFGDNLPRAESIVLTSTDDPGPGEKGHAPTQKAADYRTAIVVPVGDYAVWIVPANGTRAVRAFDKVRVLAGKDSRVGD